MLLLGDSFVTDDFYEGNKNAELRKGNTALQQNC